jgi:hypothetical protein
LELANALKSSGVGGHAQHRHQPQLPLDQLFL